AASLKYHLEWIKNRQNGCWNRVYLDPIKSIELIAENTARLHFHLPFATVTSFLSYVPGFAVSMKALKNDMALREKERLSRKARTLRKKLVKAEKKASKARSGGDDKSGKAARKAAKLKKVLAEVETRLEKIQAETQGVAKTDIHPVGSAAYMFDDRAPGNWLRVKRNPDYWYGKTVGYPDMPYFDAIKWIVIPDKAIQLANLKVGKIHFMALDYSQYDMLKKSPHPAVRITKVNRPQVTSLWFNHARGPCRDIRVRKAISHALDRKALIKGVMFGLA
ncbi:MAG: hypothetical protein GY866_35555, partial [Proteobacteria bacterium]|nr:hypothetical protein [Pseudomonadota bacterium]